MGRSLEICRETDCPDLAAFGLGSLGGAYQAMGEYAKAVRSYTKGLTICKDECDRAGEGRLTACLGSVLLEQGLHDRAIELIQSGLEAVRQVGDRGQEGEHVRQLAQAYTCKARTAAGDARRDHYATALDLHRSSVALAEDTGKVLTQSLACLSLAATLMEDALLTAELCGGGGGSSSARLAAAVSEASGYCEQVRVTRVTASCSYNC